MKSIAPLVVSLLCIAPTVGADTYTRQPGVDAVHYVFRLSLLTNETNEIRGEATVDIRFVADGIREVYLDLASPAAGKGMTVSAVASQGGPIAFTHENDRLRLALSAPSRAGNEMSFVVSYRGVPSSGLRLIDNMYGERCAFSENWPNRARQWLPMIDHPYDKATGEFVVTAAAEYQVVANGRLVEELDLAGGLRRTHWKQSVPIASWLFAIGVSHFSVHHAGEVKGVRLESWVFPQEGENGYAVFETAARQAVEFFSEHIAPYPYEKLANVQAAGLGGATEHASAIFYGEKGVAGGRAPVVHEIAHQWWGNAVTESDWDDVWLSEGFATYFTHLCTRHYQEHDAFVTGLKRDITTVLQAEQKSPDTPVVHRNLSDMTRVLNRFVYQKGGWVLHMLHGLVGEDVFWAGIRDYYQRYENGNVKTDDFRLVMERASGRDLEWFFSQWLNRSGVPRLEGTWRYDTARKQVEVTLAQTQTGELYRLPIQVGLVLAGQAPARVERAELADRRATFIFGADTEPVSVVLDAGTWLLHEAGPFARGQ